METTQARHTPGPWSLFDGRSSNKNGQQLVLGPFDEATRSTPWIAWVNETTPAMHQYTPNARLIAAAPELLEACERVLRAIKWSSTDDRMAEDEQADMLRAAIAKAE